MTRNATPPPSPADWFARIIATLLTMVGARLERPGKPGLAGPLTAAIHIRLQGFRNRLARYVARWRAGTLTPPRPRTRPAAPRPRMAQSPGKWDHLPKLPRGRAWLVRLVPGIGVGASQLQALLAEPEMRAMLAAAPQIGRTLRPYWHMLTTAPLPPVLRRDPPSAPPPAPPALPCTEAGQRPPTGPPGAAPSPPHRPPPAPEVAGPSGAGAVLA